MKEFDYFWHTNGVSLINMDWFTEQEVRKKHLITQFRDVLSNDNSRDTVTSSRLYH